MDAEELACSQANAQLQDDLNAARSREEVSRRALEAVDSTDTAAAARESMERAASCIRANMPQWIRSRLAHALLAQALKQFRERAQGPMLAAASNYFACMTSGEIVRLINDDSGSQPVLVAQRKNGSTLRVEGMSEGTRDQLYLALRLAALDLRRGAGVDLPTILDDVLMTSDDARAGLMLQALAGFANGGQVIVFTHHQHLVDIARSRVSKNILAVASL